MPVSNANTTRGHDSNSTMAANAYEVRCTDPVETGKEILRGAGTNSGGFENRASQEQGSH